MARVNPQEYADKWQKRLKAATPEIERGIQKVTTAPGQAAAKQKELMKTNLVKSIDDGRWARNVAAVTLDDWKKKTIEKGIGRISAGVDQAHDKQVAMAEKLLAAVDQSVAEANKIPRGGLEDNINRMTTFVRGMHKRKLK